MHKTTHRTNRTGSGHGLGIESLELHESHENRNSERSEHENYSINRKFFSSPEGEKNFRKDFKEGYIPPYQRYPAGHATTYQKGDTLYHFYTTPDGEIQFDGAVKRVDDGNNIKEVKIYPSTDEVRKKLGWESIEIGRTDEVKEHEKSNWLHNEHFHEPEKKKMKLEHETGNEQFDSYTDLLNKAKNERDLVHIHEMLIHEKGLKLNDNQIDRLNEHWKSKHEEFSKEKSNKEDFWVQNAHLKKGSYRESVFRRHGKEGFDEDGKIKQSVIDEDIKSSDLKLKRKAVAANNLRHLQHRGKGKKSSSSAISVRKHKKVVNYSSKTLKHLSKKFKTNQEKYNELNKKLDRSIEQKRTLLDKMNKSKNKESKTYKKYQAQFRRLSTVQEKLLKQIREAKEKYITAYKEYNYDLEDNYYVKSDHLEAKINDLKIANEHELNTEKLAERHKRIKHLTKLNENLKHEAKIHHDLAESIKE